VLGEWPADCHPGQKNITFPETPVSQ
jgi:methionyl aminopeptidase